MKHKLYQEIVEKYVEAYNSFDIENMISDMHDNVRFENISNDEVTLLTNGITELKNQAEQAKLYFKEREQRITNIEFNKDQVVIEIDFKGILAVDSHDGRKAGDKVELKGRSIFRFKDNKIIELKDIS
ncbi:MAG: nuclear transport factor 2 family protein [Bacteroidales bacterium]|nr:nuclear transport factor 2 family protein [Bacteroidales bacterium]